MKFIESIKRLNKKSKIIILLASIFLILITSPLIWYKIETSPVTKDNSSISLQIPLGSNINSIASILKKNNVIRSELAFKIYCKLNKANGFQAGKYVFSNNMEISDVIKGLKTGKVYGKDEISITFVEGKTMRYIAKTIANSTNNSEEDVFNLLNDSSYMSEIIQNYWFVSEDIKNGDIYYPLEGYLFPDTYSFKNKDVSVKDIFKTMLDEMDNVLSAYKTDIQKSNHSIHELFTLASIVEMEGISNNDRASIASVFYNRLESKMSLGSDVTTYYACKIEVGERDLYASELNSSNPYNTRGPNMSGKLPVGPISTISEASLTATIFPDETDYLYFVADKNGKVYFSKNNSEHNKTIKELKTNGMWLEFED